MKEKRGYRERMEQEKESLLAFLSMMCGKKRDMFICNFV